MNSMIDFKITPTTVIFHSIFFVNGFHSLSHPLSCDLWITIEKEPIFVKLTFFSPLHFQKALPVLSTYVRNISADSTSLKDVLASKIPEEIENVKAFRKSHGSTKVGEVTVDMVSSKMINSKNLLFDLNLISIKVDALHTNCVACAL